MATIIWNNTTFEVSAKLIESGVTFPNDKQNAMLHNCFKITVKHNANKVTFKFYDSFNNYKKGITGLNADGLNDALQCLLSDASSGNTTFDEFCSEFGYDTDSRTAYKTWKACKLQLAKFNALNVECDLYDLLNAINA